MSYAVSADRVRAGSGFPATRIAAVRHCDALTPGARRRARRKVSAIDVPVRSAGAVS